MKLLLIKKKKKNKQATEVLVVKPQAQDQSNKELTKDSRMISYKIIEKDFQQVREMHLMLFNSISQSLSLNWCPPTSIRCTSAPRDKETTD
jgi:hypothetical protein